MSPFFSNDPDDALTAALDEGYVAARVGKGVPVLDRDLNLLGELPAAALRRVIARYLGDGVVMNEASFRASKGRDDLHVYVASGAALIGGVELRRAAEEVPLLREPERSRVDIGDLLTGDSSSGTGRATRPLVSADAPPSPRRVWLVIELVEQTEADDPDLMNPDDLGFATSTRRRARGELQVLSDDAPAPAGGLPLARVSWSKNKDGTLALLVEDLRDVGLALGPLGPGSERSAGRLTLRGEQGSPCIQLTASDAVPLRVCSSGADGDVHELSLHRGGLLKVGERSGGGELQIVGARPLTLSGASGTLKAEGGLDLDGELRVNGGLTVEGLNSALRFSDHGFEVQAWGRRFTLLDREYERASMVLHSGGQEPLLKVVGATLALGHGDEPGRLTVCGDAHRVELNARDGELRATGGLRLGPDFGADTPPVWLDASAGPGLPRLRLATQGGLACSLSACELTLSTDSGVRQLNLSAEHLLLGQGEEHVSIRPSTGLSLVKGSSRVDVKAGAVEVVGSSGGAAALVHDELRFSETGNGRLGSIRYRSGALRLGPSVTVDGALEVERLSALGDDDGASNIALRLRSSEPSELADGHVVVWDGGMVNRSRDAADSKVIGVVVESSGSRRPGLVLGKSGALVAIAGIVEVRVTGAVSPGDLLTTSSEAGYARAATSDDEGAVFAKALTQNTANVSDGRVDAVITLG